jgi:hypothetical protein
MVGCWDEHQWYSAVMDRKELQRVGLMTAASHVAEVDDREDDGHVDT